MPGMSLIASLCKAKSPRGLLHASKLAKRIFRLISPWRQMRSRPSFMPYSKIASKNSCRCSYLVVQKPFNFCSYFRGGKLSGLCQVLRMISFAHKDAPLAGTARLCEFRESPKVGPHVKANLSLGADSLRLKHPSVMLLHLGHEQADRHLCLDSLPFDGRRLNILRGGVRSHTDFRLVFAVPSWGRRTVASRERGDSLVRD